VYDILCRDIFVVGEVARTPACRGKTAARAAICPKVRFATGGTQLAQEH
jgi:hypothetical protein